MKKPKNRNGKTKLQTIAKETKPVDVFSSIRHIATRDLEQALKARQIGDTMTADMEKAMMFGSKAEAQDRRSASRRHPSNILEQANKLIYGERNKTYKHPTENFENIANLWNAYFKAIANRDGTHQLSTGDAKVTLHINKIDVAYLNILQKIARGATNQEHEDTIVDIAGYAGCIERILKNK